MARIRIIDSNIVKKEKQMDLMGMYLDMEAELNALADEINDAKEATAELRKEWYDLNIAKYKLLKEIEG